MLKDNIIYHSIVEEIEINGNYCISRFPYNVTKVMDHNVYAHYQNVELRFKSYDDVTINFTPHGTYQFAQVCVYYGDYATCELYPLIQGSSNIITFKHNGDMRKNLKNGTFSKEITRVIVTGEEMEIEVVDANCLPIEDYELPSKKLISYGSSITQGQGSYSADCTYPFIMASRLGFDNINLALAGQCLVEKETVDYLYSLDGDFYILELGINMLYNKVSIEEFEKRAYYMLEKFKNKKAFIISAPVCTEDTLNDGQMNEYRYILTKVLLEVNGAHHYYIDGFQFDTVEDLTADMCHPSTLGMVNIANRLVKKYKELEWHINL